MTNRRVTHLIKDDLGCSVRNYLRKEAPAVAFPVTWRYGLHTEMPTEPTVLRKTYSDPYVLDRGKLSRMLTIIEQRAPEADLIFAPGYEVRLKSQKELLLHSAQDLLGLVQFGKKSNSGVDGTHTCWG